MNHLIEMLCEELRKGLPDWYLRHTIDPLEDCLVLHFRSKVGDLGYNRVIPRYQFKQFFESDGTGMDAMGLTGLNASIFFAAMVADGAKADRIPPMHSPKRLSGYGKSFCGWLADEITAGTERLAEAR